MSEKLQKFSPRMFCCIQYVCTYVHMYICMQYNAAKSYVYYHSIVSIYHLLSIPSLKCVAICTDSNTYACILHNRNAMLLYIHTYIRRAQRDAIAKDEQPQKASLTRRLQHASKVKKQVREIEQQKINARISFFEEGIKLDQEAKQRYVSGYQYSYV